jgi:hypothetical protein
LTIYTRHVVFDSSIENAAQSATKGYLLALWFWVFAEKHGVVAARMARDRFCLLADEAQPSTGDVLDTLIELQNRLIQSFDATPIEQRSFVQSGQIVTLPMEFFLATGFLLQSPDSPYHGRSGVDFEGDDIKLAGCLRSATEEALPLFKPISSRRHHCACSKEPLARVRLCSRTCRTCLSPNSRCHVARSFGFRLPNR